MCFRIRIRRVSGRDHFPASGISAIYEALRQVAFDERRKIHDLLIEGVELALKKPGYPALVDMKAKWQRKER
jgi:hypothetical protein